MADGNADKLQLTRRQAVLALGAGAAAVGGAAVVSGALVNDQSKRQAEQQLQDLEFQLSELTKKQDEAQKQLAAANLKLQVYQGLVGLYETLDKIGIDTVIGGALSAYKGTLDALGGGIEGLRAGIVTAENALNSFETTFASIRAALAAAEQEWANLNALLKNVQDLVKNATSPILPFLDQATRFFDDLLGKIPFGGGEGARQTINGIVGLIAAVPVTLDSLGNGLFKTLRDGWFSADTARSLETTLAKPITGGVLQPARTFLDQVQATLQDWESQVATPVQNALAQRQIVQQQIASYKQKNGL